MTDARIRKRVKTKSKHRSDGQDLSWDFLSEGRGAWMNKARQLRTEWTYQSQDKMTNTQ